MTNPFVCKDVFLINLEMYRKPDIPEGFKLQIEAQIKVLMDRYPEQFQVNVRLKSPEDSAVKVKMELVGLFSYVGNDPESDRKLVVDFINKSGLPIIWASLLPTLRSTAATMGVAGLNFPLPTEFDFNFVDEKSVEHK